MAENAQPWIGNGVCMASSHLCQLDCFRTAFKTFSGEIIGFHVGLFPLQLFCSVITSNGKWDIKGLPNKGKLRILAVCCNLQWFLHLFRLRICI